MVTEIKSKCYTCLNPIALVDPFSPASLTCCQSSDLDHQKLLSIDHQHTNNQRQTYTKQTRLQLEQYTKHIKTVEKVYKMTLRIATITRT